MTQEPTFYKILLSKGFNVPIKAVIKDENGEKQSYKFMYADRTVDTNKPGELVPVIQNTDDKVEQTHLEVAANGIEKFTTFTVTL